MSTPKKEITSPLIAKAYARVREQVNGPFHRWGKNEHLALIRYACVDAVASAPGMLAKLVAAGAAMSPPQKVELTVADMVNKQLREAFAADDEAAYASNFKKLLIAAGEIPKGVGVVDDGFE